MKEQMKEMKSQVKAKATQNLNMLIHRFESLFTKKVDDHPLPSKFILIHRSESPFTKRVDDHPLPSKFRVPQLENFDGLRDLLDYLDSFRMVMRL
jgi:mRNA-degrading endonuclease YafQ of YafQ-DinJ toxin-antitoxin module